MLRGPMLRRTVGRDLQLWGGHHEIDPSRQSVVLRGVTAIHEDSSESQTSVGAGELVTLQSHTEIKTDNRVVFVQPHPSLEFVGVLHGPRIYDDSSGKTTVSFSWAPTTDFDLTSLPYFVKLYVDGDDL